MRPWLRVALGLLAGLASAMAVAAATPAGALGFAEALAAVYTRPGMLARLALYTAPISVAAAGLAIAYRARLITIAAEGQLVAGAAAALWATAYSGLPGDPALVKAAALALASLVGVAVALLVAVLRVALAANEILVSLMLNYVAMYVVNHLVSSAWRVGAFTMTRPVPEPYRLAWWESLAIAVAVAAAYWWVASRTLLGYEADALGRAPRAAVTYGVSPARVIYAVSLLQGAAGGLAGALTVMGFQHVLTAMSVTPGYGYMGVLVAWLSGLNPLLCLPGSVLYAGIAQATVLVQAMGVSAGAALAMQASLLLAAVTAWSLRRGG